MLFVDRMADVKDIIEILAQAGERGMKISKLAMHVYNSRCTFFDALDYAVVYSDVQQTVQRLSKMSSTIIEPAERRGYYRVNPQKLSQYGQLTIDFDGIGSWADKENAENSSADDSENQSIDYSLDLFPDF